MAWDRIPCPLKAQGVADHEVMRLDTMDVRHRRVVYHQLHQHHWREEGKDHRRSGRGGQALVPRQGLVLLVQIEPDVRWDSHRDEQPPPREHRYRGDPLRFLQPHRRNSRRVLDPPETRFNGALLVAIGPQNLSIGTTLTPNRGRQAGPALLCLSPIEELYVHHHSIALLHLGQLRFRRPSPARPFLPLAERLNAVTEGMITPGPWPATTPTRGAAFIDANGCFSVGSTRILLRGDALPMLFHLR